MENLKNYRNTKQKEMILSCLKENSHTHVTAETVVEFLKSQNQSVGKATIYRYLTFLEEQGQVKKYLLPESHSSCYQFIGENSICNEHFHMMCDGCRKVVHFYNVALSNLVRQLNTENEFVLNDCKTVFHGLCKECTGGNA